MKKLINLIASFGIIGLCMCGFTAAACQSISMGSNSVCIDIQNDGDGYYSLSYHNLSCRNGSCSMSCDVQLPNGVLTEAGMCNGTFEYDGKDTGKVRIYVNINGYNGVIERYYNFRNGTRGSSSSSSDNYDNDELYLSASRTSVSTNSYVDLIIETDEDYRGKVNFTNLKYKSSSSSSWVDINKYSSTYISNYSSEWDDGYYKMTSSNDGYKKISNLLKFKKAGYYRIYAEDIDGNESYVQYNVTNSSSSNEDLDISANRTSLNTNQYFDLTINTDDSYRGKVSFSKVLYKSSSSTSRSNASSISRTSSTYFSDYSNEWSQGYYNMTSSNDGYKKISNFLKFKKAGYYRICATDTDDNEDCIDFTVSSSSSSNSNLELTADDETLSTSQYAKLFIETDSDYRGKISFTLKYKSSSSSSWTTITRTNSTYVVNYSSIRSDGYYFMTSSDNGEKTLSNLVKFKKTGTYRITATDTDGNSDYVDIKVSSSSSSSSNSDLELTADDETLSTSQYAKLFIETDSDYRGKINFTLKYKSSSSSSWTTITRTNSTYVSNYSTVRSNGYYTMTSSDDGEKTLSNLVKFKKTGTYRITATDTDGNSDYVDIKVSSSSSSSSNSDLELTADDDTLSTSQYAKLFIETDSDYRGKVSFTLKYKSSSSSTWTTITRTNSTYVSNYSTVRSNGYYTMTSSDNGEKTLSNLVKFKKTGTYRITATDTDGNSDYVDIKVSSSSSSSSNSDLELSANKTKPSLNDSISLTIQTDSDYVGKINFSAKYRSSTSSTWTNVSLTSSTYFSNRSSTWTNGYTNITSSNHGEKTVSSLFKFAKKGYYRITATDEDGNSDYVDFNVATSSSYVDGFTAAEYEMVERIYNVWQTLIYQLKAENPILKNNTTWINMSNTFYNNMKDVINDKDNRVFQDYDDFYDAFDKWLNKTSALID